MAKILIKIEDNWREAAPPAGSLGPDESSPSVDMAADTFRCLVRYRASNASRVFYSSLITTIDATMTLANIQAAIVTAVIADILAKTGVVVTAADIRIL